MTDIIEAIKAKIIEKAPVAPEFDDASMYGSIAKWGDLAIPFSVTGREIVSNHNPQQRDDIINLYAGAVVEAYLAEVSA